MLKGAGAGVVVATGAGRGGGGTSAVGGSGEPTSIVGWLLPAKVGGAACVGGVIVITVLCEGT